MWITILKGNVLVVVVISGKIILQYEQATVQLVQDPSGSNVDNLNIVRHEASRYFRQIKSVISES
jgi:hypothetical protein